MDDPKRQAWLYLISGVIAIAAAAYFLTLDASALDWLILGLGIVAVWRGIRLFRELARGRAGSSGPESDDSESQEP